MKPAVRTVIALSLTAVGLTLTLRYRTPAPAIAEAASAPAVATPLVVVSPPPSPAAGTRSKTGTPASRTVTVVRTIATVHARPNAPRNTSRTEAATGPTQTYTCQTFQAGSFGPVQVEIKIQGSRWANVVNLQLPSGDSTNEQINSYAGPQLRSEALKAENANIQSVSGATYTSDAYRESLQSCIDQWSQ